MVLQTPAMSLNTDPGREDDLVVDCYLEPCLYHDHIVLYKGRVKLRYKKDEEKDENTQL